MYGIVKAPALKVLHDTTMALCAKKCSKEKSCMSFEWIPDQSQCELNKARVPSANATIGVVFCSSTNRGKTRIKSNINYFNLFKYYCELSFLSFSDFWNFSLVPMLHLAPGGASECDYGVSIGKSECQASVKYFAGIARKIPGGSLKVGSGGTCSGGSWGLVPYGCSAESGGDWTAHYKTGVDSGDGCVKSKYQLICTNAGNVFI